MSYPNCDALREDFPHGVKIGHPAYARKHDRDKDGYACEVQGAESKATIASVGTKTQAQAADRLPQTGPGEVTAIGGAALVLGAVLVLVLRRRRTRFVA